jgi:glutathione synthase/RimK-type ligase-like ATP-grasp enzyme
MILYCGTTKDTAILLAEEMGIPAGNPFTNPIGHPNKIIRWGVGCGIGYTPKLVLNKMKAVNKAVNKLKAVEIFNAEGVPTAQFAIKAPCVGRSIEHTQGQNFWLCWENSQIESAKQEGAEYFIQYIPIKQEYRVHILGGVFSFAQRKYPKNRVSTSFMGVQGFSNNWHKRIFTGMLAPEIKIVAIDAVKVLGLDFGGVDILISQKDGKPYVAEVNTGPALPTEEVRKPYVKFFNSKF